MTVKTYLIVAVVFLTVVFICAHISAENAGQVKTLKAVVNAIFWPVLLLELICSLIARNFK
ncbi:hypothetical protein PP101_11 [Pectobacterium phage PP101]|uniref:Uncharacterized protein n=1 Tax=Pectobacterium phage PP101 TaxID=1916414 RepID=A0A1J0MEV7_9CAUD|nr:hypothetical protein HOR42_gp11 [Pectobacterium phage PP101]APD19676.1 hypothetical protein PP101_11 [Pectobacterium phage PP101]